MNIGDTVRVWKWVYDSEYAATGKVEKVVQDRVYGETLYVNGDWWVNTNDLTNKCELIKAAPQTSRPENNLPSWAVGWCHYCGAPANTFDFFDVPVCRGCGG